MKSVDVKQDTLGRCRKFCRGEVYSENWAVEAHLGAAAWLLPNIRYLSRFRRLREIVRRECGRFAALVAVFVITACSSDAPTSVTLAVTRAISSTQPPWSYEADQIRFVGFVAEPLCQPLDPTRWNRNQTEAMGECSVAESDSNTLCVKLRESLRRGKAADKEVSACDIVQALHPILAKSAVNVTWSDDPAANGGRGCEGPQKRADVPKTTIGSLHFDLSRSQNNATCDIRITGTHADRKTEASARYIQRLLASHPVLWIDNLGVPCSADGTGPFRIDYVEKWVEQKDDQGNVVSRRHQTVCGTGENRPDWADDWLVLKRKHAAFDGLADKVYFGALKTPDVDATPSEAAAMNVPESPQIGQDVDLILRQDQRPVPGTVGDQVPDQVAYARLGRVVVGVVNPELESEIRENITRQVRKAVTAKFLRENALLPITQPFGQESEALIGPYFAPTRSDKSDEERLSSGGQYTILTNGNWWHLGNSLRESLTTVTGESSSWTAHIVTPQRENEKRATREYTLSVLGMITVDHPTWALIEDIAHAWFLAPNEKGSEEKELQAKVNCGGTKKTIPACAVDVIEAWLRQEGTETAGSKANSADVYALAEPLVQALLESYVVPIGARVTWDVVAADVDGYDTTTGWLIPAKIGKKQPYNPWMEIAGAMLAVMFAWFVAWLWVRKEKKRKLIIKTQAEAFYHDMMSPLTTMRQAAEKIVEASTKDSITQQIDELQNRVQKNHSWVIADKPTSTAKFSRLLTHGLRPALQDRQLSSQHLGQSIHWEVNTAESDDVSVAVSADDLKRLFQNLLDNAVKFSTYTLEGKPTVRIDCTVADPFVSVTISDHGVGIDEGEPLEDLFKPYTRARLAAALGIPGSGQGLYICRKIVEAAGGTIRFTSRRNPTTIEVRLPVRRQES